MFNGHGLNLVESNYICCACSEQVTGHLPSTITTAAIRMSIEVMSDTCWSRNVTATEQTSGKPDRRDKLKEKTKELEKTCIFIAFWM